VLLRWLCEQEQDAAAILDGAGISRDDFFKLR